MLSYLRVCEHIGEPAPWSHGLLYTGLRRYKQWVFLPIPKTSKFLSFQPPKSPGFYKLAPGTCNQWEQRDQPFWKTRVIRVESEMEIRQGNRCPERRDGKWSSTFKGLSFDNRKTAEGLPRGGACQVWGAALQSQRPDQGNLKLLS